MRHILIFVLTICTVTDGFTQTIELEKAYLQKMFDKMELTSGQVMTRKKALERANYPNLEYDTSSGTFSHTLSQSFPGVKKEVLFERIHQWAAFAFNDKDASVKYQNLEEGKIIATGFSVINYDDYFDNLFGVPIPTGDRLISWYNILFTVADESVKVEFMSIKYVVYSLTVDFNLGQQVIERTYYINEFFPLTQYRQNEMNGKINLLNETMAVQKKQFNSMAKYAAKTQEDTEIKR